MIMSSWDSAATTASKEVEPDTQETVDAGVEPDTQETVDAGDNFPICQPEGARVLGGFGPPRICDLPGGPRDFQGGAHGEDESRYFPGALR